MATPERNISLFPSLGTPSNSALLLAYDPGQVGAANQTRLIPYSLVTAAASGIFIVSGDPNGVTETPGPALGIDALGNLWARPEAAAGNTGWIHILSA